MMQNNDACLGWLNGRNDRIRKNCHFLDWGLERCNLFKALLKNN